MVSWGQKLVAENGDDTVGMLKILYRQDLVDALELAAANKKETRDGNELKKWVGKWIAMLGNRLGVMAFADADAGRRAPTGTGNAMRAPRRLW